MLENPSLLVISEIQMSCLDMDSPNVEALSANLNLVKLQCRYQILSEKF